MEALFSKRLAELEAQASAENSTKPPYTGSMCSSSSEEEATYEPRHHDLDGWLNAESKAILTKKHCFTGRAKHTAVIQYSAPGQHDLDNPSLLRLLYLELGKVH